jgi:hypothetical protein
MTAAATETTKSRWSPTLEIPMLWRWCQSMATTAEKPGKYLHSKRLTRGPKSRENCRTAGVDDA